MCYQPCEIQLFKLEMIYSRVNTRVKALRCAMPSYASHVDSWVKGWTQCCRSVDFFAHTASIVAAMLNPFTIVIGGNSQASI